MNELADALAIVKTYGPAILVIVFVFWRDFRREDKLTSRIEALEQTNTQTLLPLVKECSAVIAQNTFVLGKLEKLLEN